MTSLGPGWALWDQVGVEEDAHIWFAFREKKKVLITSETSLDRDIILHEIFYFLISPFSVREAFLTEARKIVIKNLQKVFSMHESWDFNLPVEQTETSFSLETQIGYSTIMSLSLIL